MAHFRADRLWWLLVLTTVLGGCDERPASVLLAFTVAPGVEATVDAVRVDVRCGSVFLFTRERLPRRGTLPPPPDLGNVMLDLGTLSCDLEIDVVGVRGPGEAQVLEGRTRVHVESGRLVSAHVVLGKPSGLAGNARDGGVADTQPAGPDAAPCSCNVPCRRCSQNSCSIITNAVDERSCSDGRMCDATGECLRVNGRTCFSSRECASGSCVSGVCCNTGCTDKGATCKTGVCTVPK